MGNQSTKNSFQTQLSGKDLDSLELKTGMDKETIEVRGNFESIFTASCWTVPTESLAHHNLQIFVVKISPGT